jgi:hypothetical protein
MNENGSRSETLIQTHPGKPANHACGLTSHQEPLHGITAARPGNARTRADSETLILAKRGSGLREDLHSGLRLREEEAHELNTQ